ncbi:glutamate carboxypeptidase [Piscinibacter gummiphilus]|uniref:Glutamate carboxypeptidase n=1 Tax=Piscinibacter gummiphilus TaxID=946333 RepID=A0ABZ0CQC8_9BURK|nr:glutamate carboxypeptidase [Piscinibacter gummiphilus]WOB07195.1 glutamate carboxypeptidase [Piscinibacter gummiphilus]
MPLMLRHLRLLSLCASLAASFAATAAPDARLLAASQKAEPEVIETLRELVHIESGTANVEGIAKIAEYCEGRLKALGAKTERIKATKGHGSIVKGSFSGTGTQRILLIAHMDTVYPANTLATQPYKRDGNRLYGPGIADDKGGIAVILHSLKLLNDAGWKNYAQLTVLFNPDEEGGSGGSSELIATLGSEHDAVLSFEPTAAKAVAKTEGVLLGTSGIAFATMEVQGRSSHAGAAPDAGRNALVELSHQIVQTKDVAKTIPGTQLNWTLASAGSVGNQIPEKATAHGDVRLQVGDGAEKLRAALQEKVDGNRLVPETTTTIKMQVNRPAFNAGDRGRALALHAQKIYAELDGRALSLVPMTGGGTDAAFAARSGKAVVLESLGLAGFGYHARDEYIEIDSIVPRLYLASRLMIDLGAGVAK